jgi:hypothetical protein
MFSLLGVAAYICADVLHEVVGHGGACLIAGHDIKLLTSVYFRSTPGSVITDLGGPLSNLFFGVLIFAVLARQEDLSAPVRFFLFLAMSYNFLWFSGTILQSGFSETGDWTYAVTELNIGMYKEPVLVIAGIAAYYVSMRLIRIHLIKIRSGAPAFPLRQGIWYSYCFAGIAAAVAGLCFQPGRAHAAFEGLLETAGLLPVMFIGFRQGAADEAYEIKSGPALFLGISILFGLFCLTLGRGLAF